jgi:hypothetical protein
MRLTIQHIENLIEEAKNKGANMEHLHKLEMLLDKKQVLASRKPNATGSVGKDYVYEETDKDGNKVVYYSTSPITEKDKLYFD